MRLQQLISDGAIRIGAVSGNHNVADIGTKRLSAGRSLMSLLGMSNTNNGSLEGSDDPGRIFARNGSIKTILSALNALSLLQLQGCNWITVNSDDGDVIVRGYVVFFTVVFCLMISIPILLRLWSWNGIGPKTGSEEPDDYEPTEPIQDADEDLDGAMDIDDERGVNFTAESLPRRYADWSPEAMLCRVYDRCSERMRRALRAGDLERGARYTDRCRFLHGLMINLRSEGDENRLRVSNMILRSSDLSDDEDSPRHAIVYGSLASSSSHGLRWVLRLPQHFEAVKISTQ